MAKLGTFVDGTVPVAADFNAGAAAWTTYSPTYANLTIGNGTVIAKYAFFGRTVFVKWSFTLGSTSAVGTNPTVSVPVQMADAVENGVCRLSGVSSAVGALIPASFTAVGLDAVNAAGTYALYTGVTASIPFTWAAGHFMQFEFTYEANS